MGFDSGGWPAGSRSWRQARDRKPGSLQSAGRRDFGRVGGRGRVRRDFGRVGGRGRVFRMQWFPCKAGPGADLKKKSAPISADLKKKSAPI